MTRNNEPKYSKQNAASNNPYSHDIDGDRHNVSKPRYGIVLLKYGKSHSFRCSYCSRDKVSKKIAFSQNDPTQLICNACYGSIIAKTEIK